MSELEELQLPKLKNFEQDAQILLTGGGIKNKPVKIITDVSKVIREKIDDQLEDMFMTCDLMPTFFMTNKNLIDIWSNSIVADNSNSSHFIFKIGQDIIKTAIQKHFGGIENGALNEKSLEFFDNFLPVITEAITEYNFVTLIDLINISDFIDFSRILSLYNANHTDTCFASLLQEKSIVSDLQN